MGVTYEIYKPITDADANELNAAVENTNIPHIAESTIANHTAFTGVCVVWLMRFHHCEPGRALSRENAKMTREASTVCEHPQRYFL